MTDSEWPFRYYIVLTNGTVGTVGRTPDRLSAARVADGKYGANRVGAVLHPKEAYRAFRGLQRLLGEVDQPGGGDA
jgi:hypothetical protein